MECLCLGVGVGLAASPLLLRSRGPALRGSPAMLVGVGVGVVLTLTLAAGLLVLRRAAGVGGAALNKPLLGEILRANELLRAKEQEDAAYRAF